VGRGAAYSPAGLTGIFSTHIVPGDPLATGARGAGLALRAGVRAVAETTEEGIEVLLNGEPGEWRVAATAARLVAGAAGYDGGLRVEQVVEPPIGGGLGTSGASAMATALAVAEALGARLSYTRLAELAHRAELLCGTGLGTVSGLAVGGPVMVLEPGAPGRDRVDRFLAPVDVEVVVGFYSPVDKRSVIGGGGLEAVDRVGDRALRRLVERPGLDEFMRLSRWFAYETGLARGRVREAIELLLRRGYEASMAMIGETVFAVAGAGEAGGAVDILESTGARVLVTRISWEPAHPV